MRESQCAFLQEQFISLWHVIVIQHKHGNPTILERLGRARPGAACLGIRGDERRDDERESFEVQRGKFLDERFARACGQSGKIVLFVEEGLNRFFLSRAEGVKAETVTERRLKRHE